jgi:TonB family protein
MNPMNGAALRWSLAGVLALVSAAPASAQGSAGTSKPVDLNRRVFVDVNQVPPPEVIWQLASVIGVRSDIAIELAEQKVTLRVWNVRARTALDALCEMVGCQWQVTGRTLRVTHGAPPPAAPRSAEFFARVKKPLEGAEWNFVRAPLRDVVTALSKAVGEEVVFEGADPEALVTVDVTGETPYRAAFRVMTALGWDTRGVSLDGIKEPGGRLAMRMHGWPEFDTNPPPRVPADRVYQKNDPGLTLPRVIADVKPAYTATAMRAKIEGTVILSAVVEKDGTVGDVKVVRSLDAGLDDEAVRAAKHWRFVPGMRDGSPVPVEVTLELTFTLRSKK